MRYALVAAVALVFASTAVVQAAAPKSYNPGTVSEKSDTTKHTDYAAIAKQHAADFVKRKKECFVKAGLVDGQTFRVKSGDDTMIQVRDDVWLAPTKYNLDAVKHCAAMSQ